MNFNSGRRNVLIWFFFTVIVLVIDGQGQAGPDMDEFEQYNGNEFILR